MILANAAIYDNDGNRRRRIQAMLLEMLGVGEGNDLFVEHSFLWRGTRRRVEIVYDNVRTAPFDRLRSREGAWTILFDYPFDEPQHFPRDDIARLDDFRALADGSTDTVVWLPSFLSDKAQRDLGTLVRLEEILKGDRFVEAARHLSAVDREQARSLLQNQKSQLQHRLRACLEVAYGIATEPHDAVGATLDPPSMCNR